MAEAHGLFIGGTWRDKGVEGHLNVIDPATGEVVSTVPAAGIADSEEAISAAEAGFSIWRSLSAWTRADHLHAVATAMQARTEEAARRITMEAGKPLPQARREWALSVDQFRWHAEEARRIYGRIVESRAPGGRIEVSHHPVGIVAVFTAWNFPAVLIARKVAPALAAGCSVIIRPSSEVPGVAMLIVECLREAGIPSGVVNLVIGPTATTYNPLISSPKVRKISLTGSTSVGRQMIRDAAATMKRVSMELGGNAPLVVFPDADLDKTLDLAVPTKFANAGQVCVTPDRFFIHNSIYDAFVEGFVRRTKALRLGHGLADGTDMGPLINDKRRRAIETVIEDAENRGGIIQTGGVRPADRNSGFFFEPTVITGLPDDALAIAEENFGPVAAITRFENADDVYARANSGSFGLSAYVFTRDPARIREAIERIETGMIGINSFALAAAEAPFGGIHDSGMGREGGSEGISDYLDVKLAQVTI